MIRINLTGDYGLDKADGNTETELVQLDAFLAALRGSVSSDSDLFLKQVSLATACIKRKKISNVALQITSTLEGNTLTHDFRIVEI